MPALNRRSKQVASAIRNEIITIVRKDVSDPRLEQVGMITFSGIELSPDHRNATVWVSFMGKQEKEPEVQSAIKALQSASKFIHRLLIKRIPMKVHPHLYFKFDPMFDRATEINKAFTSMEEVEQETANIRAENLAPLEESED